VMIEAKKLAYSDLLHYVGDPKFSTIPVERMLSAANADARAKQIDEHKAACRVEPARFAELERSGSETIYLTTVDKDGNIVSLIQSNYSEFGSGLVAVHTGFVLHNRGGLFTMEPDQPNTIAPRKRPLHTIIPAFMERGDVKIGFGIMGGWNQSRSRECAHRAQGARPRAPATWSAYVDVRIRPGRNEQWPGRAFRRE
jgi:gamma-glutamyltranspeptidase/glutathione hydrolase